MDVDKIVEEMCDHYCKYPDMDDEITETVCKDCPLNRLLEGWEDGTFQRLCSD